jgi:hypothetical protein
MDTFEKRPSKTFLLTAVWIAFAAVSAGAQTPGTHATSLPKTPWGDPDLQGIWSIATITPFERPQTMAGKQVLSEQEAAELEKTNLTANNQDRRDGAGTDADVARAYNDFWWDRGTKVVSTRQTSLVVDPPDGRVPALTAEGQQRATARAARGYDSWADRSLWERCITRGLPMVPGPYNNNYQILQTPDHVVILHEMIHDARIIPLDGRPHVGSGIRQWFGDSRGRWEGNTLVVDVIHLSDRTWLDRAGNFHSEALRVVERYTRTGPDHMLYEATLEDPKVFTRPWKMSMTLYRRQGKNSDLLESDYDCFPDLLDREWDKPDSAFFGTP